MDAAIYEALRDYVKALYAPEDDVLRFVRAERERHGMPDIEIESDEGRILQLLLTTINARKVVEIGTLAGYSGLWLARALPEDGRLITLEYDPVHAEVARASFERAGLGDRIEIRVGTALESLSTLAAEGPFDAVFIDANKDGYPAYLDWAIENVRSGGLIMGHNAFSGGAVVGMREIKEQHLKGLQIFNRKLADDPRLLATIIPVGDGIAAAIKCNGSTSAV